MLNPITYTEQVVGDFLRYQLSTYAFADADLYQQMRELLNLEQTRNTPLMKGPFISLSRTFQEGATLEKLVKEGVLHPHIKQLSPYPSAYRHQEQAFRAIHAGQPTLVATGTGSGKTECFLLPIISRCLQLRDESAPAGITRHGYTEHLTHVVPLMRQGGRWLCRDSPPSALNQAAVISVARVAWAASTR